MNLHVPHSSTHIPDDVREQIVLDDAALVEELQAITDTELIAEHAAEAAGVMPWRFVNRASRLVVDPKRSRMSAKNQTVGDGPWKPVSRQQSNRNKVVLGTSMVIATEFAPIPWRLAISSISVAELRCWASSSAPDVESCLGRERR